MYIFLLSTDDEISESVEVGWKVGPPHPKAKRLLLRLATKSKYI